MRDKLENEARLQPVCQGCGGAKDKGVGACIVCWNCWRHPHFPYKFWDGTFKEWLESIKGKSLKN